MANVGNGLDRSLRKAFLITKIKKTIPETARIDPIKILNPPAPIYALVKSITCRIKEADNTMTAATKRVSFEKGKYLNRNSLDMKTRY